MKALAAVSAEMLEIGIASDHLVRRPKTVNIFEKPLDEGKELTVSI